MFYELLKVRRRLRNVYVIFSLLISVLAENQPKTVSYTMVTLLLNPIMNVLGSQNRFATFVDPKLVIFQASVFRYLVAFSRWPPPGNGALVSYTFVSENGFWFGS